MGRHVDHAEFRPWCRLTGVAFPGIRKYCERYFKEVIAQVRREDDESLGLLRALEQVGNLQE